MSHEVSETIQDSRGKWVNVYGRGTRKAGQRLPEDATGMGHKDYDTVDDAVREAKERSRLHPDDHEDQPGGAARKALIGK